jgi:hypothetical protein
MAPWEGSERRKESKPFCEQHIPMTNSIIKMETMVANIEKSVTQGLSFKTAVLVAFVAIIASIFWNSNMLSTKLGKMENQIEVNTRRLDKLEKSYYERAEK